MLWSDVLGVLCRIVNEMYSRKEFRVCLEKQLFGEPLGIEQGETANRFDRDAFQAANVNVNGHVT